MAINGQNVPYGQGMGLGDIGGPNVIFKRKYRWTLAIDTACGRDIPPSFVKLAARPNLSLEETEINYLHGKMFIPGKATWETITVTYYDVSTGAGNTDNIGLYDWILSVYDFADVSGAMHQSSKVGGGLNLGYGGTGILNLYDGCGTPLETWVLKKMWPQSVNFGELDFSSSEEVTIEMTLRFSEVQYTNLCGANPTSCCAGCSS